MKIMRVFAAAGVGMLVAVGTAVAHHAFSAEFDPEKPLTLVGTLTKAEWVNPHAWVYLDVPGPDGKVVNWAIELGPPNALLRRGWRRSSMPFGTKLKIDGFAAKNGKEFMNATNITLPDGSVIFAGSEGSGAPAAPAAPAAPGAPGAPPKK